MGNTFSYTLRCIVVGIALLVSACLNVYAQKADTSVSDTIAKKVERIDSISKVAIATEQVAYTDSAWKADSLKMMTEEIKTPKQIVAATDTTKHRRDWATWKPDPKRAMWLALVLPGAGQIYNRKYWKLPIIYGGFVGCAYAMRWNNMDYHTGIIGSGTGFMQGVIFKDCTVSGSYQSGMVGLFRGSMKNISLLNKHFRLELWSQLP